MPRYSPETMGYSKRGWMGNQPQAPEDANQQEEAQEQADPDTDPEDPDYEPPEDGPFRCDNCTFFSAPNQCSQEKVMAKQNGIVDPGGCCKFFNSLNGGGAPDGGQR